MNTLQLVIFGIVMGLPIGTALTLFADAWVNGHDRTVRSRIVQARHSARVIKRRPTFY